MLRQGFNLLYFLLTEGAAGANFISTSSSWMQLVVCVMRTRKVRNFVPQSGLLNNREF